MKIDDFLTRLSNVRRSGDGWIAKCPGHDDGQNSLSVAEGRGQNVIVRCFAGCDARRIVEAVGLSLRDLFESNGNGHRPGPVRPARPPGPVPTKPAPRPTPDGSTATATMTRAAITLEDLARDKGLPADFLKALGLHEENGAVVIPFRDAGGNVVAEKRRTALKAKDGSFWPRGVPLRVYGEDRLHEARERGEVFLVEGESDCWTLWHHGLPALGIPGASATKVLQAEHVDGIERLYVVHEPDAGGENFIRGVRERLKEIGWGGEVSVLKMPDNLKDANDLHKAGPERFKERVRETMENATPLGAEAADTPSEAWPEPAELPGGLLPVPRFPEKIIPESLRPWIADIAERFQCPLEFVAVGAVVVLGAAVGRSIGIRPKRLDDWIVVPNLWGGIVGRPGIMKSPALSEVMKPLHRLDAKAREEHDAELKRYETEKAIAKIERDEEIRAAAKDGVKKALLLDSAACSEPTPPTARRYIVNDSTIEKLGEIMNANPRGVLLFRDELTGWLRTLDREGHEGDRAFYLEAWDGDDSFTYDRIGRGTVHILAACVSVLGGIQPGPLGDYLRACVKGGAGDDGLVQRFQLLVYPDASATWRNVDRRPDIEARNRAWEIIERLASTDPHTSMPAEPGEIPFLRFDDEAQALFDEWRADLERKIRSGEEAPVIEAHLAKFRSLMPSLALLFHLAEIAGGGVPGPVSVGAAEMAAAWCELLEAHARRIYQSVTDRHHVAARLLGEKIRGGKLPNPFTARDVYFKGWSGLDGPEEVVRAAEVLEAAGWVRPETKQTGGRPSTAYHVNPDLLRVLRVPEVGIPGEEGWGQ